MHTFAHCQTAEGEDLHFEGASASGVVNGSLLEMALEQRFRNPQDCNVELVYTFPLPWDAVLLGIEVHLNGQTLRGRVQARQAACDTYEAALSQGHTGVLLSRNSNGSYTLELGNLLARETCTVVLRYAQHLQPTQGHLRLTLPTTLAPRYGDAVRDGHSSPHAAHQSDALVHYPFQIAFAVHGPLAQASVASPTHPLEVQHQGGILHLRLARSSWLDRDFTLVFSALQQPSQALAARDLLQPDTSVAMASFVPDPGLLAAAASPPGASSAVLKVLVDCSGSMAGDSIQAARSALHRIADALVPGDRFSLSRFGSTVEHRCKALWAGSPAARASAARWAQGLQADMGGTEMEKALQSTFAIAHPGRADVLLVTDGAVHAVDAVIAAARNSGHRVFAVGIGSSPSEGLLRSLASATGGACEFVAPGEAVEPAVLRMFHRLRSPGITALRAEWPPGFECLESTAAPGFAFDGDHLTFFARLRCSDPKALSGPVRRLGKVAGSPDDVVLAQAMLSAMPDSANTLARLAAHAHCTAAALLEQTSATRRASLAALAERYQLVSEDTTFVLVHERSAEAQCAEMPALHTVKGMLAAGWGGLGSVGADSTDTDMTPSFSRTRLPGSVQHTLAAPARFAQAPEPRLLSFLRPSRNRSVCFSRLSSGFGGRDGRDDTGDLGTAPGAIDKNNPELWATAPSAEHGTRKHGWNAHYEGLTPAGFVQFLCTVKEPHWPITYQALRQAGIGIDVVEWLEFVVGEGAQEQAVVAEFVRQLRCNAERWSGLPPTTSDLFNPLPQDALFSAESALVRKKLAEAFSTMQPRHWPESVLGFAEAED